MLTIVVKRSAEPTVVQMTQEAIMRELSSINGSEMLLEDTWVEGLRKVRTPYVCLVEPECVLSASYLASNFGLLKKASQTVNGKGGGYTKLAVMASCLGVRTFDRRIYNYELRKVKENSAVNMKYYQVRPNTEKRSSSPYEAQVAFIPGAIMRTASLGKDIDLLPWDDKNMVRMSAAVSFHLWNTGRRINVNPNTTYVSGELYLEDPPKFDHKLPEKVANMFMKEGM